MLSLRKSFGSVAAVAVLIRSECGNFSGQKIVGSAAVQSSEVCDSASRISVTEQCWPWHVQDPSSKGVCIQVASSRGCFAGAEDATSGVGPGRSAGSHLLVPGPARLGGRRGLE